MAKKIKLKPYYHIDTKNVSFLKMHKILKDMGIKNNKFFLKIYDRSIQYLDPFDEENLTTEQKIKIKREVRRNPWYFLREIVSIPVPGGSVRYEIHRGNLALTFCLLNNLDTLIELPRQNYKTQSLLCLMEWVYDMSTKNSEIAFLHKKYEDSKMNLDRLKKIQKLLPSYLLPENGKDNVDNLATIKNSRGNSVLAKNSAISEEQADLLGRGNTTAIAFYDEVGFIKYLQTIYTAAAPAQSQASLEAEKNGKPHFKVFLTTPGDVLTPHGKYCKEEMIDKSALFDEAFYDWSKEEIEEYINKNSENDIVYIEFSYKQLGRSEKWFEKQCRSLNNDKSKINREILLKWNRSTDLSPFSPQSIDRLRSYSGEVISTVKILNQYLLKIYKNFDWNEKLLIGGDFGGSATKDATCFSIVNKLNMNVVADFRNNKVDPIESADIIYELMSKYFPNSIFFPEQNAYSDAIISLLLKTDVANRIYFEFKEKKAETKLEDGTIKKERIKVKHYGINTNTTTRPLMVDIIFDIVENGYKDIISPDVIEDIAGLERKRNGKIEHSSSGHDDNLFSYLMVRYAWAYGTNLGRFNLYKTETQIKTNIENLANTGARSDEEFVHNFSSILAANFNNNNVQNQTIMQQQIINEYLENQKIMKERETEEKRLDRPNTISNYEKIFNYNKKYN